MKKYDALYFIKKFEKIPESKWTVGFFKKNNKKCVEGHCGRNSWNRTTKEVGLLAYVFYKISIVPVAVNDTCTIFGDHPKERILNALYTIYALEQNNMSVKDFNV